MNKEKQISDMAQVMKYISLVCGGLNIIFSGLAVYFIIRRITFLLANKDFITTYDYIYIALFAGFLIVNILGTILAIVLNALNVDSNSENVTLKYTFDILTIFGIVVLGITILALVGIVISLPKSEYVDYIKFLLFNVIIASGIGLLLYLGTFLPFLLRYNKSEEDAPRFPGFGGKVYQMVNTPQKTL